MTYGIDVMFEVGRSSGGRAVRWQRQLLDREALYRRTAEISPPGRSSRRGGLLIGRP